MRYLSKLKMFFSRLGLIAISVSLAINMFSIFACANTNYLTNPDDDIYHNNENEYMKIALTFDDGPHPRYTAQILDILEKYKIKATFFVIGINAKNYPDAMVNVIKHGHEIGNHTFSHPHVSCLNPSTLKNEVEQCETAIYELTDHKTKLFRPPEGFIDADVRTVLRDLDYKVILWDIDTRDWANTDPHDISNYVIKNVTSGDIILMHDYIAHNSPTPEALNLFVPVLLKKGYKFVVVSELIGIK